MDNNNGGSNFLDSKTILAIALVGLVWFGWQNYLQKKYPNQNKIAETAPLAGAVSTVDNKTGTSTPTTISTSGAETAPQVENQSESYTSYSGENFEFQISNFGMGVKNLRLHHYSDRAGGPIELARTDAQKFLEVNFVGKQTPLNFTVTKKANDEFEGRADYMDMTLVKNMKIDQAKFTINTSVSVENVNDNFKGLNVYMSDFKEEYSSGTFLIPSFEHQEFLIAHSGTEERINVSSSKESIAKTFEQVAMISFGNQYFTTGILDKSSVIPEIKIVAEVSAKTPVAGTLTYKPLVQGSKYELSFIGYAGPKSLDILQSVDPIMTKAVNLGFFGVLAKPMIFIMKWFHKFVHNWGFAIILLTLVVRLLVMPFTVMSYKSMKAMQKIQPALASLREKYKNDPTTLNKEMMGLMKENKVNPLGGCLPMLLQIPVFIALYQVIGQSIELYQAPFIFWIHDLSLKDPFYVLPVLMGITMFIQQKITPSTMDPTQQKIMMVLPVVFSLFMIALPSGLTLYIFVSTLFGIVQQFLLMRDKNIVAVAAKR
ncbi:MAG: membrane protein insertase YidC [Pseudobdellovibrionaceae bacterium]